MKKCDDNKTCKLYFYVHHIKKWTLVFEMSDYVNPSIERRDLISFQTTIKRPHLIELIVHGVFSYAMIGIVC